MGEMGTRGQHENAEDPDYDPDADPEMVQSKAPVQPNQAEGADDTSQTDPTESGVE
jgi:hypothetical protein